MAYDNGNKHDEVACDDLKDEQQVENTADKGEMCEDTSEEDDVFQGAEPWDPIETKIVVGSFIAAIFFLAVFGYLINRFIL